MNQNVEFLGRGTEQGSAAMRVSLAEGELRVTHGTKGFVLMRGAIDDGFWDGLWDYMENNSRITYRYSDPPRREQKDD